MAYEHTQDKRHIAKHRTFEKTKTFLKQPQIHHPLDTNFDYRMDTKWADPDS